MRKKENSPPRAPAAVLGKKRLREAFFIEAW